MGSTRTIERLRLVPLLVGMALTAASGPLAASGSMGFSGGALQRAKYNAGRQVYMKRVACPQCREPGRFADEPFARELLADERFLGALAGEEREALTIYLRTRFQFDMKPLFGS